MPGLFYSRQKYSHYVDLIGVGFLANENPNLVVCSPDVEVGRQLSYSRQALRTFYKPSVWYAVGISSGPTATSGCSFSELDVSNAYESLITSIPALVSSGIIGIAPYRFSDNPSSYPLPLLVEQPLFLSNSATLQQLRNFKPSPQASLVITSSLDPSMAISVSRVLPSISGDSRLLFVGEDMETYAARQAPNGMLNISLVTSHYGFSYVNGTLHPISSYVWFSNCAYYYTNRGPLFSSPQTMSDVVPGAKISSSDGLFSVIVGAIQESSDEEILFWGEDGRPYAAKPDGDGIKVFDRPIVLQSPLQPIMFSRNGKGNACIGFESTKMYPRARVYLGASGPVPQLTKSKNPQETKSIALLSCGGGGCLSSSPMPAAFCSLNRKASFPAKACTRYPEMDASFAQAPPLLMRAIAVRENVAFGKGPESGAFSAACTISYKEGGCGGPQTYDELKGYESSYCSSSDIWDKVQLVGEGNLCAYGVMQCTRRPSQDYNPFEPADSARCGEEEFLSKNDYRFLGQRQWLEKNWSSSEILQNEISADELDWYAAWMAAFAYSGMGVNVCPIHDYIAEYAKYGPQTKGDNLVKYVQDKIVGCCNLIKNNNPDAHCYPYYGTDVILLYNEAIKTCNSECAYQDCKSISKDEGDKGGGGKGSGGGLIRP
jgi:hypothetical protein